MNIGAQTWTCPVCRYEHSRVKSKEVRDKQSTESATASTAPDPPRLRVNFRKVEELALTKYLQSISQHPSNLIIDAKLASQFQGIDPISNLQVIFDGYFREQDHETFVDIRPNNSFSPIYRDRLYVMLSKINHYRIARRVDAHLDLVWQRYLTRKPEAISPDRMLESFEPAIAGGLLK